MKRGARRANVSLSEQVFVQLSTEILRGTYAPGAALPAERRLAELFAVNRHVVREAIKRLEQAGMVSVAQGGATRVLDYRKHAGLDLLSLLSQHADGNPEANGIWLSVLEMRASIGADAARLCARRAEDALKQSLVSLAQEMKTDDTDARLFDLEIQFWDAILEGSANLPYRLAFNTMMRGAQGMGGTAQRWSALECRAAEHRIPLARAIARGDEAAAERIARKTMREGVDAFEARFGKPRRKARTATR